jgi:PEGA domain
MRPACVWAHVLRALLLAACFGARAGQLADDPDAQWVLGLPIANSFAGIIDLTSDPSGAEATTSLGGSCRTPCALELSAEGPFTVTFKQDGYEPSVVDVKIQHAEMGVSNRKFAPNPVFAHLAPIAPPARPHAAPKKTSAGQTAPRPEPRKPLAAAGPASPPPVRSPGAASAAPASRSGWPAEANPLPGIVSAPAAPPARPPPAQSDWPGEVKPIPGINSSPIVPPGAAK